MPQRTKKQPSDLVSLIFANEQLRLTSNVSPVSEPYLDFEGPGVKSSGNTIEIDLDIGLNRRIEKTSICIVNLTQEDIMLWIQSAPQYFDYSWEEDLDEVSIPKSGGKTNLEVGLAITTPLQNELQESSVIIAEMADKGKRKEYNLKINAKTKIDQPFSVFSYNGSPVQSDHNFGFIANNQLPQKDQTYRLGIKNIGDHPLHFKVKEFPEWLTYRNAEGQAEPNPPEFQVPPHKEAALNISPILRENQFGYDRGLFTLTSNDTRPEYQTISIPFCLSQTVETSTFLIQTPETQTIISPGSFTTNIRIKNWEKTPQKIMLKSEANNITFEKELEIPAAENKSPGSIVFPIEIESCAFPHGEQCVEIELHHPSLKQKKALIPIYLNVTTLEIIPQKLDFGDVYPQKTYSKTIRIIQTGSNKRQFTAKSTDKLKDNLSVEPIESENLTVKLTSGNAGETDEIGLHISIPAIDFHYPMPVRFIPLKPSIHIELDHTEHPCEQLGYSTDTFWITNTGNAILSATLKPITESSISIKNTHLEVPPGDKSLVELLLFNRYLEQGKHLPIIEIHTNINGSDIYKLDCIFEQTKIEGKSCPNCHMISDHNMRYCTYCGHPLSDRTLMNEREVSICKHCYKVFRANYLYCPEDGEKLVRKPKEEALAIFRMSTCRLSKK